MVEVITISIYGVVLWRFMSKRRLHKSMNNRDKARSDLYLAQLRVQSAPNTPGFTARSATGANFPKHLHDDDSDEDRIDYVEKGGSYDAADAEYARRHQQVFTPSSGFQLHAPPPGLKVTSATPIVGQGEFASEQKQEHMSAAPGEQTFDAVPIPGAYVSPASPGFQPAGMHFPEQR